MRAIDRIIALHFMRYPHQYADLPLVQHVDLARCVKAVGIDLPAGSGGSPSEVLAALGRIPPLLSEQLTPHLLESYRVLSLKEGRQLGRETIDLWKADSCTYQSWTEEILLHLACMVPGSLTGLHDALMEDYFLFPWELFRDADAWTRDRLIRLVETQQDEGALRPLAWIGDDVVQAMFHRWQKSPPARNSGISAEVRWAAKDAGWELTPSGERRLLYHLECYVLVPVDVAPVADVPGPVGVIIPHDERCGLCKRQLITLFDIDLQDSRLRSLAPGWDRLRIATCEQCVGFGTVFSEVDGAGGSRWSRLNAKLGRVGAEDAAWDLPRQRLVLGPKQRSPYEAHQSVLYMDDVASQIGGFPMWVGGEPHPECPKCRRTMVFIGQLQTCEVINSAEGVTYAFLCQDCRLAATSYAQT